MTPPPMNTNKAHTHFVAYSSSRTSNFFNATCQCRLTACANSVWCTLECIKMQPSYCSLQSRPLNLWQKIYKYKGWRNLEDECRIACTSLIRTGPSIAPRDIPLARVHPISMGVQLWYTNSIRGLCKVHDIIVCIAQLHAHTHYTKCTHTHKCTCNKL